jgi:hypothetical protein
LRAPEDRFSPAGFAAARGAATFFGLSETDGGRETRGGRCVAFPVGFRPRLPPLDPLAREESDDVR